MYNDKRDSNIELLRIVAMIMIVTLHTLSKGGALNGIDINSKNFVCAQFLEALSIVAVNCYILISGYFANSSKITVKKIVNLYLQVFFYSVIITLIFLICGLEEFEIGAVLKSILPISTKSWWYVTVYMIMYILTPYFNIMSENLSKKQYNYLIITVTIIFIIWPTLSALGSMLPIIKSIGFNPIDNARGYTLYQFILLYIIGSYIRKYYDSTNIRKLPQFIIYIVSMSILSCINIYLSRINGKFVAILNYNFILTVIGSIALFLLFKGFNCRIKIINRLSKLTFGVYLIHEHVYMRKWIYSKFQYQKTFNSGVLEFLLYTFFMVCIIYITCSIIEYLRQLLLKLFIVNK